MDTKTSTERIYDNYSDYAEKATAKLDKQIKEIKDKTKEKVSGMWKTYKENKKAGKPADKFAVKIFSAALWTQTTIDIAPLTLKKAEIRMKILQKAASEVGDAARKDAEKAAKAAVKAAKAKKETPKKKKITINRKALESMAKSAKIFTAKEMKGMEDETLYDAVMSAMVK